MVDQKKIKKAVTLLLEAIGDDISRPGLIDTPDRIARMYSEIFSGMDEDAGIHFQKTFPAENNEIILEKDITFYSMCEHHLLPFFGRAHVAYIPNNRIAGFSKIARLVDVYAKRPQIQEQMTVQVADALMKHLNPAGVIVLLEAEHLCMTMRGVKKPGTKTITLVSRGAFETNLQLRDMFMRMIGM